MYESRFLYWMDRLYGLFILTGSNLQSIFLFYMRATWGHQFFLAGLAKLQNIQETTDFFSTLDIPASGFHAYTVAILELVCGIFLALGFASRLVALPLIAIMFAALSTAHADYLLNFRFLKEPLILVIQQPYPYLITALMVFIFGPGRISLDGLIKHWLGHQPKY